MTSNKYTAKVEIQLDEKKYKLKYDYTAISAIISKHGKEILERLYELTPGELASLIAFGLAEDNVSIDEIMTASPPFYPTVKLMDEALGYSYFGPEGPPKIEKKDDSKKKPEDQTK